MLQMPPYVIIEVAYLVETAFPIMCNEDVDQTDVRMVAGNSSAYDLHPTRVLKKMVRW